MDRIWQAPAVINNIRKIRKERGLSVDQLAELLNCSVQQVYKLESSQRRLTVDWLERLSNALKTKPENIFNFKNKFLASDSEGEQPIGVFLKARGYVQAGIWTEAAELPEENWFSFIAEIDDQYLAEDRFGLVVKGDSMNRKYSEGTLLDCVRIEGVHHNLENGDDVIVQREHEGKYELTVKEIEFKDNGVILWPRSTNPDFSPLIIGDIDTPNKVDSTIIKVIAFVIGSYKRNPRRKR